MEGQVETKGDVVRGGLLNNGRTLHAKGDMARTEEKTNRKKKICFYKKYEKKGAKRNAWHRGGTWLDRVEVWLGRLQWA